MDVTLMPMFLMMNGSIEMRNVTSRVEQVQEPASYVFTRRLQTVMFPIICVAGTLGNALAAGAFFSKTLRKTSCCLYLGVKSISDIGFLLSVFVIFLYRVRVNIINMEGICQITVFLSYVCPFLSIWLVVTITIENFIRISTPALVRKFCTTNTAWLLIFVYTVLSVGVYSFPLWTTSASYGVCTTLPQFRDISIIYTYVDSLLTLALPLILMIILVPLVAVSAFRAHKRKMRLQSAQHRKDREKKTTPEVQVTRLLLATSIVFFVLHTPSHSIRIKELVMQNTRPSFNDLIIHRIFELFYYLDFCASLAVYLIFGKNFRKVCKRKYCSRCQKLDPEKEHSTTDSPVSTRLVNEPSNTDWLYLTKTVHD